ncbi:B3 domain-containing protein At2g33720 [Linum perenne]
MNAIWHDREELHGAEVWKIRKTLTKSGTNNCSRLLISIHMSQQHVLRHLSEVEKKRVKDDKSTKLEVLDSDTGSMHTLHFKRWTSSGSYVFNDAWKEGFVRRRGLKEGDEVGLYFDDRLSCFVFSVLNRAAPCLPLVIS